MSGDPYAYDHRPDPRDARRPCRVCGRTIVYYRASRRRAGYFAHASDGAGLRWYAEIRRR